MEQLVDMRGEERDSESESEDEDDLSEDNSEEDEITGRTPLLVAIDEDDIESVQTLLADPTTDVNAFDSDGRSAIMYAVQDTHNEEIVAMLIARGANIFPLGRLTTEGESAFMLDTAFPLTYTPEIDLVLVAGCMYDFPLLITKAIQLGANPNMIHPITRKSLLVMCLEMETTCSCIKQIIHAGADVFALDTTGDNMLMCYLKTEPDPDNPEVRCIVQTLLESINPKCRYLRYNSQIVSIQSVWRMYSVHKKYNMMKPDGICSLRHCSNKGGFACSKCVSVRYCSELCQRKDWRKHRLVCH
jgi:ankyrin repeat protein